MPRSQSRVSSSQQPATPSTHRHSSRLAAKAAKTCPKESLVGKETIRRDAKPRDVRKTRKLASTQSAKGSGSGSATSAPKSNSMDVDKLIEVSNPPSISVSHVNATSSAPFTEPQVVAPATRPTPVEAPLSGSRPWTKKEVEEAKTWIQGLDDHPTTEEIFAWALCTRRDFLSVFNWLRDNWSSARFATKVAPQLGQSARRATTQKGIKGGSVGPVRGFSSHHEAPVESTNGQARRRTRQTNRHDPLSRPSSRPSPPPPPPPPSLPIPIIIVTAPPVSPQGPSLVDRGPPTIGEIHAWRATHDRYELRAAKTLFSLLPAADNHQP